MDNFHIIVSQELKHLSFKFIHVDQKENIQSEIICI